MLNWTQADFEQLLQLCNDDLTRFVAQANRALLFVRSRESLARHTPEINASGRRIHHETSVRYENAEKWLKGASTSCSLLSVHLLLPSFCSQLLPSIIFLSRSFSLSIKAAASGKKNYLSNH